MKEYYTKIAPDYARLRRVHPEVFKHLIADGPIRTETRILEIGCGTGNYICGLQQTVGCQCAGIDPSEQMLAQARDRTRAVQLLQCSAEQLDLPADSFDLVYSVDVIHHLGDRARAFSEARRVLRRGGRICTVTDSEEILRNRHPQSVYFPETIAVELARYPAIGVLEKELLAAGFQKIVRTQVEFTKNLESLEPYRARVFSSLKLIPQDAFERGLDRLEADFKKGPISWISRYLMLWATKPD